MSSQAVVSNVALHDLDARVKGVGVNIAISGVGYVGLSLAVLLSRRNHVYAVDIVEEKIELLKSGKSPIKDAEISSALKTGDLDLVPTLDYEMAYRSADVVIVATPTNYNSELNSFDTSSVMEVVDAVLRLNPGAMMVIKSTVPVGFTQDLSKRFPEGRFLFSPEFLREGRALYDNLHPSRIIVGFPKRSMVCDVETARDAELFGELLSESTEEENVPILIMPSTEAEAVKLFANTYLASRVSFFNELDTYALSHNLDAGMIIEGVCLDPRIGSHYNNPSFGYGGYCLPKDTKQLLANFDTIPQNLIGAIVESNRTRKDFIASQVVCRCRDQQGDGLKHPLIGVYRLTMKTDSDNYRASSVQGIIRRLCERGYPVLIYEPTLGEASFFGCEVTSDLEFFKSKCAVIVANRWNDELLEVSEKVFTRDLFRRD